MRHRDEFAEFYATEYPRARGFVVLLTLDAALAEDIAQEAFTRACLRWERLRGYGDAAWVRRVALNLVVSHRRERTRWYRHASRVVGTAAVEAAPGEHLEVMQLLSVLSMRQRAVVALHYVDDLTVDQVAAALDMPVGTVKSDLARGRRRLAETVEPR